MRATSAREALCALLVCLPVGLSVFAADARVPGSASAAAGQAIQAQQRGDSADDVTGGLASRSAAIKARDTPAQGSYAASRADRITPPEAWAHDEGRIALHSRGLPAGVRTYIFKPAVGAAARGYLTRRPDTDRSAGRSDAGAAAARVVGVTTAPRAMSRPAPNIKTVAGNGSIGGPHAPGSGTIGGPASGRTVIKASIDGSALHRRS